MTTTTQAAESSAFNHYAQYGEDRILRRIFGPQYRGTCVEVGAFDGRSGSNTLAFEEVGWTTVLVEPNPALAARIRAERPAAQLYECAVGARAGEVVLAIPVGSETLASVSDNPEQISRMNGARGGVRNVTVPQRTIDDVLSAAGVSKIDFMTIDVEGYEMDALRGFDIARWKPRIVILEDNSSGTSVEIPTWMKQHGYLRFRSSGCNDWYCRHDDPLVTRSSIMATELIKSLKAYKRITRLTWHRAFA
ncbi:FkbM family methyltransferase [Novosphingobium sp. KCTC 2891]|uniref:FkbM family methyltransferase n=1 Tax=Novosphingobium sp. KCTC 2891 TaxID=2989730 RepID=UPI0022214EF3|nr:FkbM family methyltransferase [Novosphingobium sp. KCTC 2891]MCW1382687.1 FkbM family methyltransferase [Novosphingobium sp. KCTC 2891]